VTDAELTRTGFEGDVGLPDTSLLAALEDPRDDTVLMRAVAAARLLVPIVAAPTEVDDPGELMSEKSTRMAVVTLTSPDGQRALPVFSSLAALSAWDATARPSPFASSRAAQLAVSERCEVMLLDLGSSHQRVLRPSMVWALAQQVDWLPAHADPFVTRALSRATADEPDVVDCAGEEGDPAGSGILRVVMRLRPGLDSARVQALATRVGEQIATDGEARARIDGLEFTIHQAGASATST
jgi:SseB protein N-terminal domain